MLQVQQKACNSCIYGKNSASCATPKQLEDKVRDKRDPEFFSKFRLCHNSSTACCRGFWNRHKNHFQLGQVAQRLDCVEFVTHKLGD